MRKLIALCAVGMLVAGCSDGDPTGMDMGQAAFSHGDGPLVEPDANPGGHTNPTCSQAGFGDAIDVKVDPPVGGTVVIEGGIEVEVTITDGGRMLAFDSDVLIDGVIIKGGSNANLYDYSDLGGTDHDENLKSPLNNGGETPEISHYNFCVNRRAQVEKTADAGFTLAHDWSIEKSSDDTEITADKNGTAVVEYALAVTYEGSTEDAHHVSGTITVDNPWSGHDAIITGVTDDFDGGSNVEVLCYEAADLSGDAVDFTSGYTLSSGETLHCAYTGDSDGSDGKNTATVSVDESSDVAGGFAVADFEFGEPTTVLNECAYVDDSQLGVSEVLVTCVGDLTTEQEAGTESVDVDSSVISALAFDVVGLAMVQDADCEAVVQFVNTAGVLGGSDSEAGEELGTDSHTLDITVECTNGGGQCTLTQGYWRTHSEYGPAPEDETWSELSEGADTEFFGGGSYYDVIWTNPRGNAYYILAQQYIAAELNGLNGADTSAIDDAFAEATALFEAWTPEDVGELRGNDEDRQTFIDLAQTLDDYNNGIIGPGHCDDD